MSIIDGNVNMPANRGTSISLPFYAAHLEKRQLRPDAMVEKLGTRRGLIYQLVIYTEKSGETTRDVLTAVSEELMPILARMKRLDCMQRKLVEFWQNDQE